ncbi:MAG TPA: Flp family type IVb pilin [Dehalococcoidia bacterium]|jgi:pilus assembly protein Flp/PilA|nr:Flp family type IVb pilin [Dehalococcoidia bacterium]
MFSKIQEAVLRLVVMIRDEEGQALAEYGLILGLIAVVAIGALTALGLGVTGQLDAINAKLGS